MVEEKKENKIVAREGYQQANVKFRIAESKNKGVKTIDGKELKWELFTVEAYIKMNNGNYFEKPNKFTMFDNLKSGKSKYKFVSELEQNKEYSFGWYEEVIRGTKGSYVQKNLKIINDYDEKIQETNKSVPPSQGGKNSENIDKRFIDLSLEDIATELTLIKQNLEMRKAKFTKSLVFKLFVKSLIFTYKGFYFSEKMIKDLEEQYEFIFKKEDKEKDLE